MSSPEISFPSQAAGSSNTPAGTSNTPRRPSTSTIGSAAMPSQDVLDFVFTWRGKTQILQLEPRVGDMLAAGIEMSAFAKANAAADDEGDLARDSAECAARRKDAGIPFNHRRILTAGRVSEGGTLSGQAIFKNDYYKSVLEPKTKSGNDPRTETGNEPLPPRQPVQQTMTSFRTPAAKGSSNWRQAARRIQAAPSVVSPVLRSAGESLSSASSLMTRSMTVDERFQTFVKSQKKKK